MSLGDADLDPQDPPARRGPGRPPIDRNAVRPPVRDDRLAARIAELRGNPVSADDGTDVFFIDPAIIPPGWSYEWKREDLIGKPDLNHQLSLQRRGWEAVPAHRHPEILVRQQGMILMERPEEITKDVFRRNQALARQQVQTKEAQLAESTAPETRTRETERRTFIKKSMEHQAIPD